MALPLPSHKLASSLSFAEFINIGCNMKDMDHTTMQELANSNSNNLNNPSYLAKYNAIMGRKINQNPKLKSINFTFMSSNNVHDQVIMSFSPVRIFMFWPSDLPSNRPFYAFWQQYLKTTINPLSLSDDDLKLSLLSSFKSSPLDQVSVKEFQKDLKKVYQAFIKFEEIFPKMANNKPYFSVKIQNKQKLPPCPHIAQHANAFLLLTRKSDEWKGDALKGKEALPLTSIVPPLLTKNEIVAAIDWVLTFCKNNSDPQALCQKITEFNDAVLKDAVHYALKNNQESMKQNSHYPMLKQQMTLILHIIESAKIINRIQYKNGIISQIEYDNTIQQLYFADMWAMNWAIEHGQAHAAWHLLDYNDTQSALLQEIERDNDLCAFIQTIKSNSVQTITSQLVEWSNSPENYNQLTQQLLILDEQLKMLLKSNSSVNRDNQIIQMNNEIYQKKQLLVSMEHKKNCWQTFLNRKLNPNFNNLKQQKNVNQQIQLLDQWLKQIQQHSQQQGLQYQQYLQNNVCFPKPFKPVENSYHFFKDAISSYLNSMPCKHPHDFLRCWQTWDENLGTYLNGVPWPLQATMDEIQKNARHAKSINYLNDLHNNTLLSAASLDSQSSGHMRQPQSNQHHQRKKHSHKK